MNFDFTNSLRTLRSRSLILLYTPLTPTKICQVKLGSTELNQKQRTEKLIFPCGSNGHKLVFSKCWIRSWQTFLYTASKKKTFLNRFFFFLPKQPLNMFKFWCQWGIRQGCTLTLMCELHSSKPKVSSPFPRCGSYWEA